MGDLGKPCEDADTSLGQMLDQGRYFTFNEKSKGAHLVEKLRESGESMLHREAPHQSIKKNKKMPREVHTVQTPTKR